MQNLNNWQQLPAISWNSIPVMSVGRELKRCAFVIILTTVNSHGGVQLAKRVAHKQNCPSVVMPRCGQSRFRQLITAIDQPAWGGIASEAVL
jgi:hypothetical protein